MKKGRHGNKSLSGTSKNSCPVRGMSAQEGFSLIEMVVAVAIISTILAVGIPLVSPQLSSYKIKDCAQKFVADMRVTRTSAQSWGSRAQLLLVQPGAGPTDIIGNGNKELWVAFVDQPLRAWSNSYVNGDTLLSSGICGQNITIVDSTAYSGINPTQATGATSYNSLWFTALGTMNPSTTVNSSIVFADSSNPNYLVRVNIISIIGAYTIQACSLGNCSQGSSWFTLY